ncbi:hypothetical protein GCM10009639_54140 [Kitasatospora putterlickiae]|uniref:HTH cro/C1-type domain-containing protein n=1 Tax=Kitasatospora putterlickiae TaxID=221725 RepID=A0ABN1YDT7_9ACTN
MSADDQQPDLQQQRWEVGARLRALRLARGLSQIQLQTRSGVDNKTISRYENGHRNAGLDDLTRLAHALEVPVWRFFREP